MLARSTKLFERERSGMEVPGQRLAARKELPLSAEDFCLPNKAAGVKNASDAASFCWERGEKMWKKKYLKNKTPKKPKALWMRFRMTTLLL